MAVIQFAKTEAGVWPIIALGTSGDVDRLREEPYPLMPKQPSSVKIVEQGGERFLLKTYADGTEERVPIVAEPPKKKRLSNKIAVIFL